MSRTLDIGMSFTQILVLAIVSQVTGLAAVFFILKAVTDRLFRKQEDLLRSVQVMVNTLSLQREDNAAMLLAAQMLRTEADERGVLPLPYEDRLPPAKSEVPTPDRRA